MSLHSGHRRLRTLPSKFERFQRETWKVKSCAQSYKNSLSAIWNSLAECANTQRQTCIERWKKGSFYVACEMVAFLLDERAYCDLRLKNLFRTLSFGIFVDKLFETLHRRVRIRLRFTNERYYLSSDTNVTLSFNSTVKINRAFTSRWIQNLPAGLITTNLCKTCAKNKKKSALKLFLFFFLFHV